MDSNNFNHFNIPSNSEGVSNIQSSLLSPVSFLCDDVDLFDSLSAFDFAPFENLDSSTLAQDIDDFTDLLREFESNQSEFPIYDFNDMPPLLSPGLSPLLNSFQPLEDIPQFNLPEPSILYSNQVIQQPPIRKSDLQIPQLPLTKNNLFSRSATEQKKEYRQKKYSKYLQKKRLRNKQKNIDPTVRYHSRQTAASKRQRINGKFARECPAFIPANQF